MNDLFLKIINMSISASWLVLAVLLLRFVLKKAPKWVHVLLWGIVALRLISPFSIESSFSLIPDSVGNGKFVSEWADDYIGDLDFHHSGSVYYDAAVGAGREPISDGEGGYYVVTKHDQLGEPDTVENTVIPILSVIWISGMIFLALYTAISYWRLRRKVSEAVILRDNIFQSENVASPFVLGVFRPRIYLPYNMDGQDLGHVVAHEQAHIRRRDHWWKPLGFLLLTVHWFNPLMWLAYVLLCRDIELACDEKVIKELGSEQRADYSQALVSCSINRRMVAACPLAFGEVGVKERVKSVMNYKKPAFWFVVVAVAVCAVAGICFLTDPVEIDVTNITAQKGYAITNQQDVDVTLTIPKAALPDSIYTDHTFGVNEVPVYRTDTSTIYLERVMQGYEGEEMLYFIFNISHDLPENGRILLNCEIPADGGSQLSDILRSEVLFVDGVGYEEGVLTRSIGGPRNQFAFYIPTDLCKAAQDSLEISVALNELSYEKLPWGIYGAFGHIAGYGISTDPVSGRESYHIRVEDLELSCTKEQYEDVKTYMDYVHDGLIEDGIVLVRYDQFLISEKQGELLEIKFSPYQDSPPDGSNSIGTLNRPPDYEKTVKTFADEAELARVVGNECLLFDPTGLDVEDFGATLQFAENGLASPKLWEKLYVHYRLTDKTEFMMHVYFEELDKTNGFPLLSYSGTEIETRKIGGYEVRWQDFLREKGSSRMLFHHGEKTYEITATNGMGEEFIARVLPISSDLSFLVQDNTVAETSPSVFVFDGVVYDLAEGSPSVNAVMGYEIVGDYIVAEGHVGPYNGIYGIINTKTQKAEKYIAGTNLTWHSDDINTIVYSFWSDVCAYDGTVLASLDLASNGFANTEYISNLSFSDDFTQVKVEISSDDGTIRTKTVDIPA